MTDPDGPTVHLRPAVDLDAAHLRHRRGIVVGAALGGIVLLAVAALVVGLVGGSRSGPVTGAIGDPRTADPCSLLRAGSFDARTTVLPDFRIPARCAAVLGPVGATVEDSGMVLTAELTVASDRLTRQAHDRGDLVVVPGTEVAGRCERLVVLPDGNAVELVATVRGPAPSACAPADAAVAGAESALRDGALPRRPADPADALTRLDVCRTVDPQALAAVPGLDPRAVTRGFADWACRWGPRSGPAVQAAIYRTGPFDTTEPVGDRRMWVGRADNGVPGGCSAAILHREYRTSSGGIGVESLQITVAVPGAPELACDEARRLAGNAVTALDGLR